MKKKYTFHIAALFCLICWTSCLSDPNLPTDIINAKAPEIQTLKIEGKTATTITISAEVLKENGMPVTEYGVYWSKDTAIDTTKAESISVGKGKGVFTAKIEGLDNNSTYYVAPYAKNKKGIGLGETEVVNTADGLGTVTTFEPKNVTASTVDVGGEIGLHGEGSIKNRGVFLSLKSGAATPDTIIYSEMEKDSFICNVTKLNPNTTYYVKAFVENTFGYFWGEEKSFITSSGLPKVAQLAAVEINFYDATFKAKVENEGDVPVLERGFCYKIEDGKLPTIANDTIHCGEGAGAFEGKIINLSNQFEYHIRAYAKNKFGVAYSETDTVFSVKSDYPLVRISDTHILGKGTVEITGTVLDEGRSPVVESGFCWSTTNATPDSTDNIMPLSSGKKQFSGVISKMKGNTIYYIRAYAKNSVKTVYSEKVKRIETPDVYRKLEGLDIELTQGSCTFFHSNVDGFLLGGDKGTNYTTELWRYNYIQGKWIGKKGYPEEGVFGQSPVVVSRIAYIFGGKNASDSYSKNLYKYSTYDNIWTKVDAALSPDPIAFAAGCNLGESAYYIGGVREGDVISNEVSQYNSLDEKWSFRSDIPKAQFGGIAVVHNNNTIYAGLGSTNKDRTQNNKEMWFSNDFGVSWNACASIPLRASRIIGGVMYNDNIYVVDNNGQIWQYSVLDNTWTQKMLLSVLDEKVHCIYLLYDEIFIGLGTGAGHFVAYRPYWDN